MKTTENGKLVLDYLVGETEPRLGREIAEGVFSLSPRQITGVLNGLYKNGLVDKTDDQPRKYTITDKGREHVEAGYPEGDTAS